jgi:transposase
VIDEFAPVIDSMLRAEILMKAAVIHDRVAAEYGFTGNYQRTKLYVQEARPRIAEELGITPKELAGMHRRFEVIPGAQAQVDWGDEGKVLAHMGIAKVYSFHMTLSYSRDPFCCFTTSQTPHVAMPSSSRDQPSVHGAVVEPPVPLVGVGSGVGG